MPFPPQGTGGAPQTVGAGANAVTNATVATNSFTALNFDAERWDTANMHDPAVNPSRMTIPEDGKYLLWCNFHMTGNAAGYRILRFRANGLTVLDDTRFPGFGGADMNHQGSLIWDLTAGDYVEVVVWQNSGGNLTYNSDREFVCIKLGD